LGYLRCRIQRDPDQRNEKEVGKLLE